MPNVCLAAGLRLTVVISFLWMGSVPAWGQLFDNPFDANRGRPLAYFPWNLSDLPDSAPAQAVTGPAAVSIDILRHPLSSKARRLLERAMQQADRGNHAAAIESLREALAKYPSDAAYTQNVLGLEYIETRQFGDAQNSFGEAARLMPNESCNHSNYGLALAITGQLATAEKEERKALELDPNNPKAKSILELLLVNKRITTAASRP